MGVGDARVTFQTRFDDRQLGEEVRFTVWRDRRELDLTATAVRIPRYDRLRNDPLRDGVSRMSAYLHYGHVSSFRIAREAHAVGGAGAENSTGASP